MRKLFMMLLIAWLCGCAFVFGQAAPLGFVVFGIVLPVGAIATLRFIRWLVGKPPPYYG